MCPTASPESIGTARKGRVGKRNRAHDWIKLICFSLWPGKEVTHFYSGSFLKQNWFSVFMEKEVGVDVFEMITFKT